MMLLFFHKALSIPFVTVVRFFGRTQLTKLIMLRLSRQLLAGLFFITPSLLQAQSAAIIIDEDYSDWDASLTTYTDGVDVGAGDIDLLDMQVTNDADFFYVKLTVDTEIDITDNIFPHNLWLYLDTDDDPNTGYFQQFGYGSELAIDFNDHYAWFDVPNPDIQVSFDKFQLRVLPTVSATTFELAIGRNVQPNGIDDLFLGPTVRVLVRENNGGDSMPDVGTVFSYTFDETPVAAYPLIDMNKSDPDHIRIVAYNVLSNGLQSASRVDNFESIITALSPDIIGFSECGNTSSSTVKGLLDTWLPLGTADGWYTTKSGDRVTCSKWDFIDTWSLSAQYATLIDLPATYPKDLLFVNSHLSCCANDAGRQAQVDEFVAFIQDAKSPGGAIDLVEFTPIVYGGDLNLVGFSQQLTTLLTGDIQDTGSWGPGGPMDWDGSDLLDLVPLQSDKNMAYTWRDDSDSDYPPGRLDFQLCTDVAITVEKSFVVQTEVMTPDRLALYGLNSFDTENASDHFPVVADYSMPILLDDDGDLIPNDFDNCPGDPNFDQADWNNDGTGDVCQDSDGDGLIDADELLLYGTDPGNSDSDNDGLDDGEEVNTYTTDPLMQDTDGDGLTDGLEASVAGISPLSMDTDNDGCNDDLEFSLQCPDNLCNPCPGDFNSDGFVDTADLLSFLSFFGFPCD